MQDGECEASAEDFNREFERVFFCANFFLFRGAEAGRKEAEDGGITFSDKQVISKIGF